MFDESELPVVPSARTRMIFNRNIQREEFIVYKANDRTEVDCTGDRRHERLAWAYCTSCEREMLIPRVTRNISTGYGCSQAVQQGLTDEYDEYWPGSKMACPCCGEVVTLVHTSSIGEHTGMAGGFCAELIRIGSQAVVVTWYVRRWLSRMGMSGYDWMPAEAYTVESYKTAKRRQEKLRMVKFSACRRCACSKEGYTFDGYWRRKRDEKLTMPVPDCVIEPEEGLTSGTTLEKSGIEAYMRRYGAFADRLIAVWLKHRNVENIAMQAPHLLGYLLAGASHTEGGYYSVGEVGDTDVKRVDWTRVRPHEMLGLDKDEMRKLEADEPGRLRFEAYMEVRQATGERITDEVLDLMSDSNLFRGGSNTIRRIAGRGAKVEKVMRYCHEKRLTDPRVTVMELLDTWDWISARIGRLTPDVMWPRDLMLTHDRERELYKGMEAYKLNERINERFRQLSEYSWEDRGLGLCIRPAASGTELHDEGCALHHCVETYAGKVASGQTAIFFIRKRSRRRESFYTLELDEELMEVRQNRGLRNCPRTPEVEAFEEKWLAYAKKVKMNTEGKNNGKSCGYGA